MSTASQTLTQRTAAGVAWTASVQLARQVLQVVSVSVLARHVAPEAYGLMAMAVVVTGLVETIRDLGLGQALIREREVSDDVASTMLWMNLLQGGAVSLLVVLAAWPAAYFFHEPLLKPILQVLALSFFLGAVGVVPTALLTRSMEFRKLAVIQTAAAIGGTAAAITVALAGGKVWSLVSGTLAYSAITAAGVWLVAPVRLKFVFRYDEVRRFLSFGMNLSGFHVLNYFSRNADNLLVGCFLGSMPLGFYQMGYMLMTYPLQNFALMVSQVAYPAISRFHEDHARFREAYVRTSAIIALVTVPAMLGLTVVAHPFVRVILGPRWMPVASLLTVFAPLGALQSLYAPVGLIFEAQARTDLRFRWMKLASICYVLSFVVGLRWGFMGVAICYSIMWLLLMVPSFLVPFRLVGLSGWDFLRAMWPHLWMGTVMAGGVLAWRLLLARMAAPAPTTDLASSVAVGTAIYVGLALWCKPPAVFELATILEGSPIPLIRSLTRLLSGSSSTEALPRNLEARTTHNHLLPNQEPSHAH